MTLAEFAATINDDAEHYRYFWVCAAMQGRHQTEFWAVPAHRILLRPDVQVILDAYRGKWDVGRMLHELQVHARPGWFEQLAELSDDRGPADFYFIQMETAAAPA